MNPNTRFNERLKSQYTKKNEPDGWFNERIQSLVITGVTKREDTEVYGQWERTL